MGNPWTGAYITASGNLLADMTSNVNAEMQGHVQVARLHRMTDDRGVKDLPGCLLARDTMHQNQWLAAARELQAEGNENLPVPGRFPKGKFTYVETPPKACPWPRRPIPTPVSTAPPSNPMSWRRSRARSRRSSTASSYPPRCAAFPYPFTLFRETANQR
jgi:hypothetical protein